MQVIKPPSYLTGILNDEIGGEMRFKPFPVFKRIMALTERHGARFKPAIQHFRHPAHPSAAIRADGNDLVEMFLVQVLDCMAGGSRNFSARSQHQPPAAGAIFANPDRDGRAPVPRTGDVPIPGAFEPFSETAMLHVFRHPVNGFVQAQQVRLDFFNGKIPGIHGPVNQRGAAAPAMRVVMFQGAVRQQAPLFLEPPDDIPVAVMHIAAGEIRHFFRKTSAGVHGVAHAHAMALAEPVVLLAECRRAMHNAYPVRQRHEVRRQNAECTLLRLILEVRKQGVITTADQVLAGEPGRDAGLFAKHAGPLRQERFGHHQHPAFVFESSVLVIRADRQRKVGRQGPGCGGPGQVVSRAPLQVIPGLESHQDFRVLARPGGIGFAGIGYGQGRFAMIAIRGNAVIAVNQTALVRLLEDPQHGFHVIRIQRAVGMFVIHPATDLADVLRPGRIAVSHQIPAGIVERGDAITRFDFRFIFDAQLFFDGIFDRQPVAIPAPAPRHRPAGHREKPRHGILEDGDKNGSVVRRAGRKWRAVIKHHFPPGACQGFLENALLIPFGQQLAFLRGKINMCGNLVVHRAAPLDYLRQRPESAFDPCQPPVKMVGKCIISRSGFKYFRQKKCL